MAIISCPECGKEISDKAACCPNCGYPIQKAEETKAKNNNVENQQKDYTKIAAEAEKKTVESRMTRGNHSAGIAGTVLGIIALLAGIFDGEFALILGGLFFLALGIVTLGSRNKDKKRIQYLQNVSDGKKEILICPYCKGINIKFDAVQSEVYTSGQTARVADNINPLHPFTHTNIKTTGTRSSTSYKTLYICQDCGKTFEKPDKVWS